MARALQNPAERAVVVIGHGNVALDCARILAKASPGLMTTDLASRALPVLGNGVSHVSIVGRRGHAQASFTIKEIRELAKLEKEGHDAIFRVQPEELEMGLTPASRMEIEKNRPRSRIHKLLQECASKGSSKCTTFTPSHFFLRQAASNVLPKTVDLRFLLNPVKFVADDVDQKSLSSVVCERTTLEGETGRQRSVGTGELETLQADLALVSIGYQGVPLAGVEKWFDSCKGVLLHDHGLVDPPNERLGALLTAGWLKRGPSGIIGTNIPDAKETVGAIISAIEGRTPKRNRESLVTLLKERHIQIIDWKGYRKIEQKELEIKRHEDQPREKLVAIEAMLKAAMSG